MHALKPALPKLPRSKQWKKPCMRAIRRVLLRLSLSVNPLKLHRVPRRAIFPLFFRRFKTNVSVLKPSVRKALRVRKLRVAGLKRVAKNSARALNPWFQNWKKISLRLKIVILRWLFRPKSFSATRCWLRLALLLKPQLMMAKVVVENVRKSARQRHENVPKWKRSKRVLILLSCWMIRL